MKSLLFQFSITLFLLCAYPFSSQAQSNLNDDGGTYTISATGSWQDFKVPSNTTQTYITFTLVGADGGSGTPGNCDKVPGGAGAEITAVFRIGNEDGQIPKGATIRFIPGEGGRAISTDASTLVYAAAAGGGGTGLLIEKGFFDWEILAVAGGGGGAFVGRNSFGVCRKDPGNSAQTGPNGGQGDNDGAGTPGTNGNGAKAAGTGTSNGGGGAFSDALASDGVLFMTSGRKGMTTGGVPDIGYGGYGFGSGGSASNIDYRGGGGGGYSGGAAGGEKGSGGGGGSYVSPNAVGYRKIVPERTTQVNDGKIEYQFYSACEVRINKVSEHLSYACRDIEGSGSVSTGATLITDALVTGECDQVAIRYYLYELRGSSNNIQVLREFNATGVFENVPPAKWRVIGQTLGANPPSSDRYDIEILEEDPTPTTAKCVDAVTIELGSDGQGTLSVDDLDEGSTGKCGIQSLGMVNIPSAASVTYSTISYDCNDVGFGTIYLKATDNFGNSDYCAVNVYIEDNVKPRWIGSGNARATVYLDDNGQATVTQDDILDIDKFVDDCNSTDQLSFTFSGDNAFTCTDLGENAAALDLEVSDLSGNFSTYTLDVTVVENNAVVAHCQNVTVQLDASGEATISTVDVDNGSSDGCGIPSLSLDITSFDCENVGDNTVLLTATNSDGESDVCNAVVLVIDDIAPTAICQDLTVQLDDTGEASIVATDIDNGSNDVCGIDLLSLDKTIFDCEDIGVQDITLTATDQEGNESSCTAKVTVVDDIAPVIAQCQDLTVQLRGAAGSFSIVAYKSVYFQHASDNCELASIAFIGATTLTCEDIGVNERGLEAIDGSGNRTVCNFNVTVQDDTEPEVLCQDITAQLDADGNASITTADIDNGSNDACGITSLNLDKTDFSCDDLGNNTVMLTATDESGNTSNCQATVTVQDNIAPQAICQDVTVQLDADGNASITAANIDNGSNDACGIASLNLDKTNFSCDDLDDNTILLTATDENGNTSSCQATVEVLDQMGPTLDCDEYQVNLDENGSAEISAVDLLDGPFDACGIASYTASKTSFSCQDLGTQQLTVTVTDNNGNTSTCTLPVSVMDYIDPIAICQDVTIQLGEDGTATLSPQQINDGSSDNCSIGDLYLTKNEFDCNDIGQNTVTLEVEDKEDNISSCQATVQVVDQTGPTLDCDEYEVALDENGSAEITTADLLGLAFDACGIAEIEISRTTFSCQDFGDQSVTLSATDNFGNTSSCQMIVYVFEQIRPTALCKDATIQLDAAGTATLAVEQIDNGSFDNCSIFNLSLDQTQFDCSNIGENTVRLRVFDTQDYGSSCQATVTVVDEVAPNALCQNVTIQLNDQGQAIVAAADIDNGSTDACGIATLSLDQTSFTCDQTGDNTVTLSVTDNSENSASCQATVTVVDDIKPTLTCAQDMTVNTDEGECGAYVTLLKAAPADNCSIQSLQSRYRALDEQGNPVGSWSAWASDHSGFFELGSYQIQWRAKDPSDNENFCSFQLDIIDEEAPEVICTDITINFNGEQTVAIVPSSIFDQAASFDACGTIAFVSQSITEVSCQDIGQTLVAEVVAADPSGNTSTCSAAVFVTGLPCSFAASDIDCPDGAAATYDPEEESFTLTADDCSGYPYGELSLVATELCGDGEIIANIASLSSNARVGVIMMEDNVPGARFVSNIKDSTPRTRTEYRSSTDGSISFKSKNRYNVKWLKIIREGTKFKTYTSTNGSYWRLSHTINFSNFEDCIYAGLVLYSKDAYAPATAVIKEVKIIGDAYSALAASPDATPAAIENVVETAIEKGLQADLQLSVAPNPFAEQTQITFNLPAATEVTLEVYNLHGQRVQSLENARLDAGNHRYQWNGQSSKGEALPTGIYMLRLRADKKWITAKVSLVNR